MSIHVFAILGKDGFVTENGQAKEYPTFDEAAVDLKKGQQVVAVRDHRFEENPDLDQVPAPVNKFGRH